MSFDFYERKISHPHGWFTIKSVPLIATQANYAEIASFNWGVQATPW